MSRLYVHTHFFKRRLTLFPFFIIVVLIALCPLGSFGRTTKQARLTNHVKDSLKIEIEQMLADDQKYRWMLEFGEVDSQKINAWKRVDDSAKFTRMKLVMDRKAGIAPAILDSLGDLQSIIDAANFSKGRF
ncbi:MAG: hypothetical protein H7257_08535 [Taibaiella sp.]|nr:hypothetical protein [Taibaiella sp.]